MFKWIKRHKPDNQVAQDAAGDEPLEQPPSRHVPDFKLGLCYQDNHLWLNAQDDQDPPQSHLTRLFVAPNSALSMIVDEAQNVRLQGSTAHPGQALTLNTTIFPAPCDHKNWTDEQVQRWRAQVQRQWQQASHLFMQPASSATPKLFTPSALKQPTSTIKQALINVALGIMVIFLGIGMLKGYQYYHARAAVPVAPLASPTGPTNEQIELTRSTLKSMGLEAPTADLSCFAPER